MENGEKKLKQFKRLKTPQMSEGTRNRRETRAGPLRERSESSMRMIEKTVWQDEKDFILEVLVNLRTIVFVQGSSMKEGITTKSIL